MRGRRSTILAAAGAIALSAGALARAEPSASAAAPRSVTPAPPSESPGPEPELAPPAAEGSQTALATEPLEPQQAPTSTAPLARTLSAREQRLLALMEVAKVRKQYSELQRRQQDIGIAGPITMMSIGGGLMLLGTAGLLAGESNSSGGSPSPTSLSSRARRDGFLQGNGAPLGVIIGGGILAGIGTALLMIRLEDREQLDERIYPLKQKLKGLGLSVSGGAVPGGAALTARGYF